MGFIHSCTAPIDIHTDNSKPVIVIYGILTDTLAYQSVVVSGSSPYFDDQPNSRISGAQVIIRTSDNEQFNLIENDTVRGLYLTGQPMAAKIGVTYYLSVVYDFDKDGISEVYEARSQMLPKFAVDSVSLSPISFLGRNYYRLSLFAQDPPETNFFLCRYLVNDSVVTSKISQFQLLDDEGYNGQYINGSNVRIFPDVSEKDQYTEDEIKDRIFVSGGDEVTLEINNIEEGYFNFINQCQKEKNGENPFFGGPASNIQTNISNGGTGYFAVYPVTKIKTKVP